MGGIRLYKSSLNKKVLIAGIFAVLIIVLGYAALRHHAAKSSTAANQTPSQADLASGAKKAAAGSLKQKNYTEAVNYYLVEASQAPDDQHGEQILQEAIGKIPDADVPYTIYDSLSIFAKNLNQKDVEISSLQKALTKAQQAGSGAPSGLIDYYKQQLKSLGAAQ